MPDDPILTPRQSEILRLLAEGCTTRQIADLLYVEAKTISIHLNHIYKVLDAHSRAEAVVIAHQRGLL